MLAFNQSPTTALYARHALPRHGPGTSDSSCTISFGVLQSRLSVVKTHAKPVKSVTQLDQLGMFQ